MNTTRPCDFYEERLTSYLLGDLPEAGAAEVRNHLESCRLCRASARELAVTLDLLRGALAETAPSSPTLSPERRRRVLAAPDKGPVVVSLWKRYGHAIQWAAAVLVMAVTLGLLLPAVSSRKSGLAMMRDGDDRNGRGERHWGYDGVAPTPPAPPTATEPASGKVEGALSKSGAGTLNVEGRARSTYEFNELSDYDMVTDAQAAQAGEWFGRSATEGEKDLELTHRRNDESEVTSARRSPRPAATTPTTRSTAAPIGSTEDLRRSGASQVSAGALVVTRPEPAPAPESKPEASAPAPAAAAPPELLKALSERPAPGLVSGGAVVNVAPATPPANSLTQKPVSLEILKESVSALDPAATATPPAMPAAAAPASEVRWDAAGSGPAPAEQPAAVPTDALAVDGKGQSTRLKKLETPLPKPMFVGTPVPVKLPNLEPAKPMAGPGGWAGQQDLSGFQMPGESRDKLAGQKAKTSHEVAAGHALTLNGTVTLSGGTTLGRGTPAAAEPARKLSETVGGAGGGGAGIAGKGRMDFGLATADDGVSANQRSREDATKTAVDTSYAREVRAPGNAPKSEAQPGLEARERRTAADTDGDRLPILGDMPVIGKLGAEWASQRGDVSGKDAFKHDAGGRQAEEAEAVGNRVMAADHLDRNGQSNESSREESKRQNEEQQKTVDSDKEESDDPAKLIILPSIQFRQTPIQDVVKFLEEASKANDPQGKGVKYELALGDGTETAVKVPPITMNLRNVNVNDTTRYVADIANLRAFKEGDKVVLRPFDYASSPITSRAYDVQPAFIDTIIDRQAAGQPDITTETARNADRKLQSSLIENFFKNAGVKFPSGASVSYDAENSKLIVSNTAENLEVLERITAHSEVLPTEPALDHPIFKPAGFNPYVETATNSFSTFSIDVDTASFAMARRSINEGRRPEPESVRTEEFVNAFDYDYAPPAGGLFAVHAEYAPSPFRRPFELLKIGVKAKQIGRDQQRSSALTLVVDTSGSMNTPDRLGRIKETLKLLVERLDPSDSVALVQFDTQPRLVLEQTAASDKVKILAAVDGMVASGSTQLEGGLKLGYEVAAKGFRGGASNRVLLLSDGVANLGAGEAEGILQSVENFRRKGVYLSVFGFGTGTYNDAMLEALADKGDGQYVFIDSLDEAKRVIVENLAATLHVVAKDAKIQVEFNPKRVKRYRQIGYENRALEKEQFRDDTVDAGEVGSGQSVTALYEIELQGPMSEPIGTVRVRAQNPENGEVEEIARRIGEDGRHRSFESAPARFRLAAGVAEFAEQLRLSPYTAGTDVQETAGVLRPAALELNLDARVQELVRLVQASGSLPVK